MRRSRRQRRRSTPVPRPMPGVRGASAGLDESRRFAFLSSIGVPMLSSKACRRQTTWRGPPNRSACWSFSRVARRTCCTNRSMRCWCLVSIPRQRSPPRLATCPPSSNALRARLPLRSCFSRWPRSGIEPIVGVRNHPGFGSLLVVGLGGIFVELLKETQRARLGPVDEHTARLMLDETQAGRVLRGLSRQRSLRHRSSSGRDRRAVAFRRGDDRHHCGDRDQSADRASRRAGCHRRRPADRTATGLKEAA